MEQHLVYVTLSTLLFHSKFRWNYFSAWHLEIITTPFVSYIEQSEEQSHTIQLSRKNWSGKNWSRRIKFGFKNWSAWTKLGRPVLVWPDNCWSPKSVLPDQNWSRHCLLSWLNILAFHVVICITTELAKPWDFINISERRRFFCTGDCRLSTASGLDNFWWT